MGKTTRRLFHPLSILLQVRPLFLEEGITNFLTQGATAADPRVMILELVCQHVSVFCEVHILQALTVWYWLLVSNRDLTKFERNFCDNH